MTYSDWVKLAIGALRRRQFDRCSSALATGNAEVGGENNQLMHPSQGYALY
jgi:hypothetical protein